MECKGEEVFFLFDFADFLIYCFVTAYTPGPNNLLSMSYAAKMGFRRSCRFNIGIAVGFFIVMSVCTVFTSTLYSLLPKVKIIMQVLGAAYMLFLAWKTWKSSGNLETEDRNEASFFSGLILQFMNFKIYIYAITAMSLYVLPVYHSTLALAGFSVVLTVIGTSGNLVWAMFGTAFCRFFAKHAKTVNFVMALLLVYCAVSLFL